MKIIILAAGKGERLMPLTRNTPKSLLDMGNGATLLEEQIGSIAASGVVDELVLVIGYLADQVEAKMHMYRRNGLKITTVYNPFYEVSNNLMSLWLAKHEMNEDFMITNGDNLFTPDVFTEFVCRSREGIHLAIHKKNAFDFDDMKVQLDGEIVRRVSKQIDSGEAYGESPGLALVRGERSRQLFTKHLDMLSRDSEYLTRFWLEVFNHLYQSGVPVEPWEFDASTKWQEVDFHSDIDRLKDLLALKSNILKNSTKREAV